ncbi:MAG: UDP-N-acetylmuramoyl-L-alanyl-D-glutamate--2,6-diaminopimelate ligase [Steroidobacteraceae bacterium]
MNSAAASWRPLRALLGGQAEAPADLVVADVTLDSCAVVPGGAFLACRGRRHHGLQFLPQVLAAGARVVLWEPAAGVSAPQVPENVFALAVPELHAQAGYIADRFFNAPSASLEVTGITGTNGKTTTAWLLAQALQQLGQSAAYIGTLGIGTLGIGRAGELRSATHTTPDAITLQRELAALRDAGVRQVALEVSSHALDQERCAGVRFQVAVFTNLTRDHLDYHADMQAYGAAKAKLFDWPTLQARVINVDDEFGAQLAHRERPGTRLVRYARRAAPAAEGGALFVQALRWQLSSRGIELQLASSAGGATLTSPLLGEFNIENLLAVLGVLLARDLPLHDACAALARCVAAPGRMQVEGGGELPLAIVDYAHTPDALAKALRAARAHCVGKLWCVFGCGGERDPGKRPQMGRVAANDADFVIVTDDNPRGEDPQRIVADILAGFPATRTPQVIHERATAIRSALAQAQRGDVVLVAGKGHEDYQLIGAQRRSFSDAAEVHAALLARSAA